MILDRLCDPNIRGKKCQQMVKSFSAEMRSQTWDASGRRRLAQTLVKYIYFVQIKSLKWKVGEQNSQ